ncbi:hypothetical protein CHCC5027_3531 [Bacillus paralicheniformis]|uniref:hypothetical protein n=1 Tax=Bacillus paralicheniformis TaxID=1648923 RepID=UPI0011AA92A5|nr:hypothetical protein [Bacillus paralicheniformis]TWJ39618.1 hypothetical protein CHCC5027_3531 [Bacillus paralicheniformis]
MNPDEKSTYVVFYDYCDPYIRYFDDFGKAYTEYRKDLEEGRKVILSTIIECGNFEEGSYPEDMLE